MRLFDALTGEVLWEDQGDRILGGTDGAAKRQDQPTRLSDGISNWPESVWFDGTITPRRGRPIAVSVVFKKTGPESLAASVDCPFDKKFDQKADEVKIDGAQVTFRVPVFGAQFTGNINAESDAISGSWSMRGETAPIFLRMRQGRPPGG